MQKPSLLQSAKSKAPAFKRPDIKPFIPEGQQDAVDRIVAAGMRMMYSPEMKDEVLQAVNSDMPMGKKLGENAGGLLLTLDKQSQGGLPVEAMFPAGAELMSEAADMLIAAGQTVTNEDWKDGFFTLIGIIGKQFGGTDETIMAEIGKHVPQGGGEGEEAEGAQDMAAEPEGEPTEQEDVA